MPNPGRLPEELLRRFACDELAVPPARYERALQQFERRFDCHLVTYRVGCIAVGGPERLCSNAYAAMLSDTAAQQLKSLEAILQDVILIAYDRPWRFRPFRQPASADDKVRSGLSQ
jgi:hypothetical protein